MVSILKAAITTQAAITNVAADFSPTNEKPIVFRVISNRAFHILTGRVGTVTAVNGMFIPANHPEIIRVNVGEKISHIRDAGETDGEIWFTEQSEQFS